MFRTFVAEHLDADVARRLGTKEIVVFACALLLRRRGRPRKQEQELIRLVKEDVGLPPDQEIPDKIEALQRLAATVGIPRLSPQAVEDQVLPLLARLTEIRRERDAAMAQLSTRDFASTAEAQDAFDDADAGAAVQEDEALRTCATRKKASGPTAPKTKRSGKVRNSRRRVRLPVFILENRALFRPPFATCPWLGNEHAEHFASARRRAGSESG